MTSGWPIRRASSSICRRRARRRRCSIKTLRFDGDADIVRQIRIGRHPNNTTRRARCRRRLELQRVRALQSVSPGDRLRPRGAATPAPIVAASRARPSLTGTALPRPRPARPPRRRQRRGARRALAPSTDPSDPRAAPPSPTPLPAKMFTGGLSISRQLGLGVSRIVIDPGHGGHDPGTKARGVTEAELVLDVALRLEKLLQKISGVEVILTRRTDEFIPLPERTAIANREGADLFLSIHVNSSPNAQARGIETYFLNFANNQTEAAVAARENAESTQAMGALPDFVKAIALNNKLDESRDFATEVQKAMLDKLRAANKAVKDRGVKQAPFVVLIGAAMPSVLAEISLRHQSAGSQAAAQRGVPPADRRSAARRGPEVSDLAQGRHRHRASVVPFSHTPRITRHEVDATCAPCAFRPS